LNKEQIIRKLNWFYSLELNQVELYIAQSKQSDDIYLSKVFERAASIEQQHVNNIAQKIKELGAKPIVLGNIIAPILGKIGGNITSMTGIIPMLKANILLEQRAMADYRDFILKAGNDPKLFNLLWSNLIDEDFHAAWFSRKLKELQNNR